MSVWPVLPASTGGRGRLWSVQVALVSEVQRVCLFYPLVLCLAIMSGCGFRMGGGWDLPAGMGEVDLLGGSRDLYRELKRGFAAAGGNLRKAVGDGTRLRILGERFGKRTVSVNATGKALEYELFYVLEFDVIGADRSVMVEPQRLDLVRDYLYVDEDVYGTSRQERLLREQMRQEMVGLMLHRIQALVR